MLEVCGYQGAKFGGQIGMRCLTGRCLKLFGGTKFDGVRRQDNTQVQQITNDCSEGTGIYSLGESRSPPRPFRIE